MQHYTHNHLADLQLVPLVSLIPQCKQPGIILQATFQNNVHCYNYFAAHIKTRAMSAV